MDFLNTDRDIFQNEGYQDLIHAIPDEVGQVDGYGLIAYRAAAAVLSTHDSNDILIPRVGYFPLPSDLSYFPTTPKMHNSWDNFPIWEGSVFSPLSIYSFKIERRDSSSRFVEHITAFLTSSKFPLEVENVEKAQQWRCVLFGDTEFVRFDINLYLDDDVSNVIVELRRLNGCSPAFKCFFHALRDHVSTYADALLPSSSCHENCEWVRQSDNSVNCSKGITGGNIALCQPLLNSSFPYLKQWVSDDSFNALSVISTLLTQSWNDRISVPLTSSQCIIHVLQSFIDILPSKSSDGVLSINSIVVALDIASKVLLNGNYFSGDDCNTVESLRHLVALLADKSYNLLRGMVKVDLQSKAAVKRGLELCSHIQSKLLRH